MTEASALDRLAEAEVFQFADWPNKHVPLVCAGVYAIWDNDGTRFLYVGMSGRGKTSEDILKRRAGSNGKRFGLSHRLSAHASGRRSGDQFCVYVCDRLVIPKLTTAQLRRVADGQLKLDDETKKYIRNRLSYRFVETKSGDEALRCESKIKNGELDTFGLPFLNPGKSPT